MMKQSFISIYERVKASSKLIKIFLFLTIFVGGFLMVGRVEAATYYVDSSITDSNIGSSTPDCTNYDPVAFACSGGTASAYKTIADINLKSFSPDDQILFRKGQSWAETLTPASSGTIGHPITFGAYGTGANPLFNRTNSRGIDMPARNDITIQDIDLTNTGAGSGGANIFGSGAWSRIIFQRMTLSSVGDYNIINFTYNVATTTIDSVTAISTGSRFIRLTGPVNNNITISNSSGSGGDSNGIEIKNTSNLIINQVTYSNSSNIAIYLKDITGTLFLSNISISSPALQCITLENVSATLTAAGLTCTSAGNVGLYILNSALGLGSTISNSTISNSGSDGVRINSSSNLTFISVTSQTTRGLSGFSATGSWSNINYTNCSAIGNSFDGYIWAGSGSNSTVTNSLAQSNLVDGFSMIEGSTAHDVTCNYCLAISNGIKTDTSSGDGFTSHDGVYNFNINNSIAINNTQSGVAFIASSSGTVYNSTFYNNGGAWSSEGGGKVDSVRGNIYLGTSAINSVTNTNWILKNNISQGGYPFEIRTNTLTDYNRQIFDYNSYYHPANNNFFTYGASPISWLTYHNTNEANSSYGNPLFSNDAGSYSTSTDFQLLPLSPAIDSGTTTPNMTSTTTDFAGNPIYGTPDIGAYEYQPPYTITTDNPEYTGNVRIYGDGKYRYTTSTTTSTTASLKVTPAEGIYPTYQASTTRPEYLNISNITWGTSKQWTASSTIATTTVYTIGDLTPNTYYTISVDGLASTTYQSNGSGVITYTYSGGYSTHTFTVTPDTTSPSSFALSTPVNNANVSNPLTLVWNASTDTESGISKYQLYIDNTLNTDSISSTTNSITLSNHLSCGTHTWYVIATDNNSNTTNSDTLTFRIPCPSSSGGTAQSRVNNLLAMGNTTLANQVAQQYNIVIPNQVVTPMTNIIPTFSRYLQLGQIGNDVKQLQIFLNSKGYIISSTGPGSKGNETTMFGSLTKKALMKFQKDNKIPSTGYFGPMTRKFVNEGR